MATRRVVAIPGEDAAPEAFEPTVALLDRLGLDLAWVRPSVGEAGLAAHGKLFPDEARAAMRESDRRGDMRDGRRETGDGRRETKYRVELSLPCPLSRWRRRRRSVA